MMRLGRIFSCFRPSGTLEDGGVSMPEKKAAAASPRAVLRKLKASLRGSLKKERAGDLDHLQAESPTILTRASDPRAAGAAEAVSTADEAGIFTFQSCQAEASGCDHTEAVYSSNGGLSIDWGACGTIAVRPHPTATTEPEELHIDWSDGGVPSALQAFGEG